MSDTAFGLAFDPRALTDLLQAPPGIRDLALAQLQDVVRADLSGSKLTGDLTGFRRLYVDERAEWRTVYARRPAPPTSVHPMEIYVVAMRPNARNDAYETAMARLGLATRPVSARTHAARATSPQLGSQRPAVTPAPPGIRQGLPAPAPFPTAHKERTR